MMEQPIIYRRNHRPFLLASLALVLTLLVGAALPTPAMAGQEFSQRLPDGSRLRTTSPDISASFRLSPPVDGGCGTDDKYDLLCGLQKSSEVKDMQFRSGPTEGDHSGSSAEVSTQSTLLVLGVIWLVGLALLILALDMRVRHR